MSVGGSVRLDSLKGKGQSRCVSAGKAGSRRGRKHRQPRHDSNAFTYAGPVTITKPDGTVIEQDPLDRPEYFSTLHKHSANKGHKSRRSGHTR